MRSRNAVILWSILMCMPIQGYPQAVSATPVSPHPSIRITTLEQDHAQYPDVLEQDTSGTLQKNTFIIHNDDTRDVVAMLAVWTITDEVGHTSTSRFMSDSYSSLVPNSVVPGTKVVGISPDGWLPLRAKQASVGKPMGGPQDATSAERARLARATSISLQIDSVVYADGELCGPNRERLDQALTARKEAASKVAHRIRSMIADGSDWKLYLNAITGSPTIRQMSKQSYWEHQYANMLIQRGDDVQPFLIYLEALPPIPQFHECSVSPTALPSTR